MNHAIEVARVLDVDRLIETQLGPNCCESLRISLRPGHRDRGVAGQVTDIARNDGMKNGLKSANLLDKFTFTEQHADYDRGKGQSVTESLLTKDKGYDEGV